MQFSNITKNLFLTNKYIFVDFDNTLFFTNKSNNLAYMKSISKFIPEFNINQVNNIDRITKNILQNLLYDYGDEVIQEIILYKKKIISSFNHLNKKNINLIHLLESLCYKNKIFLITCGDINRVLPIIEDNNIKNIFSKMIFSIDEDFKYDLIIHSEIKDKTIVFDDDYEQLTRIYNLGIDSSNLYQVKGVIL